MSFIADMKINQICNGIYFGKNSKTHYTGGRQPIQIYAVNPDTNECIKYDSLAEMARTHGVITQVISSAYRSGYKIHGFMIKKSSDIEDKNGNIDRKKLLDVIKNQPRRGKRMIPVYAISPDGSYKRYDSQQDLTQEINCPSSNVAAGLKYGYKVRGLIIRKASDIEDEEGNVDEQKIKELAEKSKKPAPARTCKPKKVVKEKPDSGIYAVNSETGKFIRFTDVQKAAEIFGTHVNHILHFLANPKLGMMNFHFVRASKVENKDGNADTQKIMEFLV